MNAALTKRQRFKNWRMSRPFWGATLSLLSGLIILYIPIQLIQIAFAPGNLVVIGIIFGGLIVLLGILGFIFPKFNIVFGVLTMFLAVLSIMGALGGFFIGTLLGIIGGALSIAWRQEIQQPINKEKDDPLVVEEVAASSSSVDIENTVQK